MRVVAIVISLALCVPCVLAQAGDTVAEARQALVLPSQDARILMRWWWFGPAVVPAELDREMRQMKAGGIGGFEIQPVYPQALDDPTAEFKNLPYLSTPFLEALSFTNHRAQELGLRADMTLSSGWPYGGPHTPITQAAGRLRLVRVIEPPSSDSVALPAIGNGEKLIAAFVVNGTSGTDGKQEINANPERFSHAQQLTLPKANDLRIRMPEQGANITPREVWFFLSSRTGQMVKRAAVGADGFVLDHFDKDALNAHLSAVGEPLMAAFGDKPPYAVFSDSLEVYESDWTPKLPEEFLRRRGYDLVPLLPLLFAGNTEEAKSIRHDWGETLTELVNENYLQPIAAWAHEHHTRFRSQTYGTPAVNLSSNALVDLPEGEGPQWRSFSYTRWASSANHLYDRNITSAETWTWLHSPAFRATPLDMKAEADAFFLQGVNQLVGHGWPYTPPGVAAPGWALYAAAVFNDSNPWWIVMPDVTTYLQRVSALLREGHAANDVAVFVPTDDALADFKPGHVAVTDAVKSNITPALTASILDAGYSLDYIDSSAILAGKLRYPILILPSVDRISSNVYNKISDYAAHGGHVIAISRVPEHGAGFLRWREDSAEVTAVSRKLFSLSTSAVEVVNETALSEALHHSLAPDVMFSPAAPECGFLHRKLADGDIYFIANTGNHPVTTKVSFHSRRNVAEVWNPVHDTMRLADGAAINLSLAPYESVAVLLRDGQVSARTQPRKQSFVLDLGSENSSDKSSGPWTMIFDSKQESKRVSLPYLWNKEADSRYYSGTVTFARDFEMPLSSTGKQDENWWIDFGPGTPIDPLQGKQSGTHALLEGPVREAAVITINGKRAGAIWTPPYRVNVTRLLHAGRNHIEIRVANTSINTLAGRSLPDYRLLNQLYGDRFQPQDMDHLEPLPSGIVGDIKLVEESGESVQ